MTDKEKAFLEGFKASAEGWNGEYPYDGASDEQIWEKIKHKFKSDNGIL